jgi:putative oxidoreductase
VQSVEYCAIRLDDYRSMSNTPRSVSVPALDLWAPLVLAILRITTGLILLEHGLAMVLPLPSAPTSITLSTAAGLIEVAGGLLIAAGLYTRVAALICSAEMAMAWSVLNLGDAAILFCVVFFYLVFAGPGRWSMDAVVQEHC